ncbi:hypothetical protein QQF64_019537 [Cirrhinus molitorella]|uniref:Uncharacterized protein n=1 Tax=Cirrhinus molitorella TaxID=172907 RepID=A0ABR3LI84_9TELE
MWTNLHFTLHLFIIEYKWPFQVKNKLHFAAVRHLLRGPVSLTISWINQKLPVPFTFHFVFRDDVDLITDAGLL